MTTFIPPHAFRALFTALTLAVLPALGACSTHAPARHSLSTSGSLQGQIASARAFEKAGTLYVAGTMKRSFGHGIPAGAHVHIELLDQSGRVIASEQHRIVRVHPRQEKRRLGRYSFAVGFPLETTRKAERIHVSYHPATHS